MKLPGLNNSLYDYVLLFWHCVTFVLATSSTPLL